MDFIEVSAKTVEDAITKACVDLGLSSDQLDIQVISEGSSGFLGIGSKPAVIQVRKKEGAVAVEEATAAEEKPAEAHKKGASRGAGRTRSDKEAGATRIPAEAEKDASAAESTPETTQTTRRESKETVPVRSAEEVTALKETATQFLRSVFQAMELPVDITLDYEQETGALNIDMAGADMGLLIGKRGQTLDSLQYLTSLVVNKGQKDYVRVKLDTEDYRKRRKETLENLAKNIASKVRRNQKAVTLEAMNPYERRIIHSALQGNSAVSTYSEGNEPYRHVVVVPKKGN